MKKQAWAKKLFLVSHNSFLHQVSIKLEVSSLDNFLFYFFTDKDHFEQLNCHFCKNNHFCRKITFGKTPANIFQATLISPLKAAETSCAKFFTPMHQQKEIRRAKLSPRLTKARKSLQEKENLALKHLCKHYFSNSR